MSKKWHLLSALLLLAFLHVNAQQELERKSSQLKVNIALLGLNANYELRLLKYTTLNFEAGVDMGISYSNDTGGSYWAYALVPNFSGEVRQYYGIARRAANGRRVDNNAGSFFSLTGGYAAQSISSKNYHEQTYGYVIPAWGMQRSWGKHFSFEARFGWTLSPKDYGYNSTAIDPLSARMQVGYVIW
jgi:hypothetical protein